ncbi:MAG: hypothetical protein ACE5F9_10035 [Phycisphaerae bacterium]
MSTDLGLLCGTAASIALLHTILGPDHYLPFVALSRVRSWSLRRTVAVTVACGVAHVLSSVVLGLVGIALGVAVFRLDDIESLRGSLAGWLLLAFGVVYLAWGVHRAIRNRPHSHLHAHTDGTIHAHTHAHTRNHAHPHDAPFAPAGEPPAEQEERSSITPWVLFVIFIFGPCEPLIPLVMYPAAQGSLRDVVIVTAVFGLVTIGTMTTVVLMARAAAGALPFARLGRYSHAAAGLVLCACGLAVCLGL